MIINLESGYRLHISEGNRKTGQIPSFSLTPGRTCSADASRTSYRDGCYARKMYNLRQNVRAAYDDNTAAVLADLPGVEAALMNYFTGMAAPRFFRVHVSGDFVSAEYAAMWARVAAAAPHTNFLAFTKQWDTIRGIEMPGNMQIILSAWPGIEVPADLRERWPVAWMDDGSGAYDIPANSMLCPGDCEHCGMCWTLSRAKMDVTFYKH